jgi:hypothetical protein
MSKFLKITYLFIVILSFEVNYSFAANELYLTPPNSPVQVLFPPTLNCPVSLYDQARLVKGRANNFTNLQKFSNFFTYYKKFASLYNSQDASSPYYVLEFGVPTTYGWKLTHYPANTNVPDAIYPVYMGPTLPTPFSLSLGEITDLSQTYTVNPMASKQLMGDIWLLRYYETNCGKEINDLNNIPENPTTQGVTGYGNTPANSGDFEITLDPDLWTTVKNKLFTINGSIGALKNTFPSLLVAYGSNPNNLNKLAPADGKTLFNAPMAAGDSINFTPLIIDTTSIYGELKDKTVYFNIVDKNNPSLAYLPLQSITLDGSQTIHSYNMDDNQTPSDQNISSSGGIMKGICDGPDCDFNDLIRLFKNIWNFIIIIIVPIVAIVTAWVGFNFMKSGAEYREKAKEMMSNLVIGILLVIFAWFIVKTILDFTVGKDSCYSFLGVKINDASCIEKTN